MITPVSTDSNFYMYTLNTSMTDREMHTRCICTDLHPTSLTFSNWIYKTNINMFGEISVLTWENI